MKRWMCLAATAVAIGLILTAAHAQRGDLDLHVAFPLIVEDATLAAGENEARGPAHLMLGSRNQQDQAAAFDQVESVHSRPADAQVCFCLQRCPSSTRHFDVCRAASGKNLLTRSPGRHVAQMYSHKQWR